MFFHIQYANVSHLSWLVEAEKNHNITVDQLQQKLEQQEVLILLVGEIVVGWLRFGWFWDEIPFMNMLEVEASWRKQGLGSALVNFWEQEMLKKGHNLIMTSSQSDEESQHFYRKLGFSDAGGLTLPGEIPEILFTKNP